MVIIIIINIIIIIIIKIVGLPKKEQKFYQMSSLAFASFISDIPHAVIIKAVVFFPRKSNET